VPQSPEYSAHSLIDGHLTSRTISGYARQKSALSYLSNDSIPRKRDSFFQIAHGSFSDLSVCLSLPFHFETRCIDIPETDFTTTMPEHISIEMAVPCPQGLTILDV
jgi:hypothetical protein